ncbi:hypothetical protein [Streptomyces sp. NA02950]|nr:hypothetical protein [Streptomyces sp. NA02950]
MRAALAAGPDEEAGRTLDTVSAPLSPGRRSRLFEDLGATKP